MVRLVLWQSLPSPVQQTLGLAFVKISCVKSLINLWKNISLKKNTEVMNPQRPKVERIDLTLRVTVKVLFLNNQLLNQSLCCLKNKNYRMLFKSPSDIMPRNCVNGFLLPIIILWQFPTLCKHLQIPRGNFNKMQVFLFCLNSSG